MIILNITKKTGFHCFSEKFIFGKTAGEWGVGGQSEPSIRFRVNFLPFIDSSKPRTIHSKCDNIGIIFGKETNQTIEKLFDSLLQNYQKGFKESAKGSKLVFDSVDLMHNKLDKISLNCGGSYIDSPKWSKNKKAIIIQKIMMTNAFNTL